ncbi:MAG: sulfurtransferase complex subunit TusD [Chromatocurvus sp.]
MRYTLLALSSPSDGQCLLTAARVATALIHKGHELNTVFFSDAATAIGLVTLRMPQDEISVQRLWQSLADEHGVELVLCVASAMQRGVLSADNVASDSELHHSLAEGFRIGGLGQLIAATHAADRVLTFGG